MNFNPTDLWAVAPEMVLVATAAALVKLELLFRRGPRALQVTAALGLALGIAAAQMGQTLPEGAFNGMVARDGVARFLKTLLGGVALLAVLMSRDYWRGLESIPAARLRHGEYYAVMLVAVVGMTLLSSATDLVTVFLGLETMSVALYVLCGLRLDQPRSAEAAVKYLLLGAFFTGFLLYGMALLYGASGGRTNLAEIAAAVGAMQGDYPTALYVGAGMVLVGFLFKVAAAPFHFWTPDVYQGAPTPVTALMSAGPKAAAFAAFLRLFAWTLPDLSGVWVPVLWLIAAVTMTVGNLLALAQQDVKRMLAYSSIAHAGYLLVGVLAASAPDSRDDALAGVMFYLAAYYFMNLGAFTAAMLVATGRGGRDYSLNEYQGLAHRHPWAAAALTLFMISLAGIPPTAGFFGKLLVFSAAVKASYVGLVVIAVLNSVVSVFYYLRLVVQMYMKPLPSPVELRLAPAPAAVLIICALGIAKFGVLPGDLVNWAKTSSAQMVRPLPTIESGVPGR